MKTNNVKTFIDQARGVVKQVSARKDVFKAIEQVEELHTELREQLDSLPSAIECANSSPVGSDALKQRKRLREEEIKKSALLTIGKVLATEGWTGLYNGLSSGFVAAAATWSTYFYAYNRARSYLLSRFSPSTVLDLGNSTFAGIITCIVTNPLWVVNTRLKLRKKSSTRPASYTLVEVQRMIAEEGISSCFKGLGAGLVLVTNPAIQFFLIEKMNEALRRRGYNDSTITPLYRFLIGAISKMASTLATYPLQVIKTRQQEARNEKKKKKKKKKSVEVGDPSAAGKADSPKHGMQRVVDYTATGSPRIKVQERLTLAPKKNSGSQIAIFLSILQYEGIGGLYRGLSVKMVQTVLNSAFIMFFQDIAVKLLKALVKKHYAKS
tara:strand:+ start:464 stop:1606 length:1143 start_codon:yes stop_codon:yes gene_type:complete